MNTVLITGCSTGFGEETARHFLDQGWTVVATMRNPAASKLAPSPSLRVLPLDVTDAQSIAAAVEAAGPLDALVNNAGIGWFNALEGTPLDTAREVFEVNLFGTLAMMQEVLPGMRQRRSGVIVNISSSSIYSPLPMLALYRASKAAVAAMTEAVVDELAPFGIRAKVVVPGLAPATQFAANIQARVAQGGWFPEAYADFARQMLAHQQSQSTGEITSAQDVAAAVFRAVTDPNVPNVLPAGRDAIAMSGK